jgi:hypothetical protein
MKTHQYAIEMYLMAMAIGLFVVAVCGDGPFKFLGDLRNRFKRLFTATRPMETDLIGLLLVLPLITTLFTYAYFHIRVELVFPLAVLVVYGFIRSRSNRALSYLIFVGLSNFFLEIIEWNVFAYLGMCTGLAIISCKIVKWQKSNGN